MAKFTGRSGREYGITVSAALLMRVEKETGVRLTSMFSKAGLTVPAFTDDYAFLPLLLSVMRPTIEGMGVSEEQLLEDLTATEMEAAAHAIVDATIDYFPEPQRSKFRALVQKSRAAHEAMRAQAVAAMEDRLKNTDFNKLVSEQLAARYAASTTE